MAFLCPSRLGNSGKGKREKGKEPARRGRITGSDSIDTIEQTGLDSVIYSNPKKRPKIGIIHNFFPVNDGEIQVLEGEVVDLVHTKGKKYFVEKSNGLRGYISSSVCFISEAITDLSRTNSVCSSQMSEYSADLSENASETYSVTSENMSLLFKPTRTAIRATSEPVCEVRPFHKTSHGQYIALFDFFGMNENDVSIERAELVEVLNIEDPDWSWVRKYDGLEGFVPKTYICPVEPLRRLAKVRDSQRSRNTPTFPLQVRQANIPDDSSVLTDTTISLSSENDSKYNDNGRLLPSVSQRKPIERKRLEVGFDFSYQMPKAKVDDNHILTQQQSNESVISNLHSPKDFLNHSEGSISVEFDNTSIVSSTGTRNFHLRKAPLKSKSNQSKNVVNPYPDSVTDFQKELADFSKNSSYSPNDSFKSMSTSLTRKSSERSFTDVTDIYEPDVQSSDAHKIKQNFLETNKIPNQSDKDDFGDFELGFHDQEKKSNKKEDPFKNVTEELALILKKRQKITEGSLRKNSFKSLSARTEVEKPSKSVENNFVEYIMKYEYKGQTDGQQNVYLQKGEAIYADMNNQNNADWIWVYIPRTEQHGYVPKTYAEKQTTVVL